LACGSARWPKFNHAKKNNAQLRNGWSRGHLAWLVVHGVYYACTIWWSYCLGPTCHIHMHGKGEKLARAFFLLHTCWTSWLSSRRAQEWLDTHKGKEGSREKTTGRAGRARGYSWAAHLVVRWRSSPTRAHSHIRYTRGKWSESRQASDDLSVLLRKSNPVCLFIGGDAGCWKVRVWFW
jgi:hypothetical protein